MKNILNIVKKNIKVATEEYLIIVLAYSSLQ